MDNKRQTETVFLIISHLFKVIPFFENNQLNTS